MRNRTALPAVAVASPAEAGIDIGYQRTLLGVVMLAVMAFGSLMTIVTVALGKIAEDLDSDRATLTWVITGLMLAMAVSTPLTGKLGDLYGHRKIFLIGLVGGALATVACGLAWNALSLIVFRVIFGMFGACVNPNALALMMNAYGAGGRAKAVGWFQFAMTGAPTIGLVVGGPMIDIVGWRPIFISFAGVTGLAFVAGYFLVRATPTQSNVKLDYPGAATLALGVLSGLLAITRFATRITSLGGAAAARDLVAWGLVVLAAAGIFAFVKVEERSPAPMLKLNYFKRRNFVLPMVTSALIQFAYMGGFVVTPALLTKRYGWTVGGIALLMAPRPAAFSIASPFGGHLPSRFGEKIPIMMGAACMAMSMIAFTSSTPLTSTVGIGLIVVGLILSGLAAGLSQPSVSAMVVSNVDPADMGIANGMAQQLMFIGTVCGIQTMNVLVGESSDAGRFFTTFLVGTVVAFAALATAASIIDPRRAHAATATNLKRASQAQPAG